MKLIKSPDPVLTQVATEWNFGLEWPSADELEDQMLDIMNQSKGIGLAANQVGVLKRVFCMRRASDGRAQAMFNPEVVNASKELQIGEEGCLSFPDLWIEVERPMKIDVKFLDKNAQECKMTLTGIDARCFLHELDHLNGICFTDKVSQLRLAMARKNQVKQQRK